MHQLPPGYKLRRVNSSDFDAVIKTLQVLTTVGDVSQAKFDEILEYWEQTRITIKGNQVPAYNMFVITDDADRAVATGTVLIEKKIIHCGGLVGHIEDIAVSRDQQGKSLGRMMIEHLTTYAHDLGCYKVILDCSDENVGFYKRCGYLKAGVEMSHRL
ncbi:LAMI_0G08658g1_1 [Lachancea mirantina]|uniref:Glucosamine 6-phosphate N-acetyltransferase n=1 Tax=Lachancea mirantina TaxID=1230905 RepID=A0A1G4KA14_9SACH|nr:LAMI_0G08658g1_1 [Lachancea mirantina]